MKFAFSVIFIENFAAKQSGIQWEVSTSRNVFLLQVQLLKWQQLALQPAFLSLAGPLHHRLLVTCLFTWSQYHPLA